MFHMCETNGNPMRDIVGDLSDTKLFGTVIRADPENTDNLKPSPV
jgi:hypothetical protein